MSTSNFSSAFPSNLHTSSYIKLTRNNHPFWKAQIVPTLQAHDLFGHVDGSLECPAKVLLDSTTGIMKANPAYASCYQKVKLILSILFSSLTEETLAHVISLDNARAVWQTLEQHFALQSQARLLQTRVQLANLKKGLSLIADYFQRAQSLSHAMAATGHPINDEDLVAYILAELSVKYIHLSHLSPLGMTPSL